MVSETIVGEIALLFNITLIRRLCCSLITAAIKDARRKVIGRT